MIKRVIHVVLLLAVALGTMLPAVPAQAWVDCGPPDACVPSPCDTDCTICLIFDDETGELRGVVFYNC